jgi:flavin reductase (DIM6/NTAB) family NADH-FMN oxidoreductase RutF
MHEGTRFRRAAGQFSTGVTVLSTVVDGEPHGMTLNAFASVSIEPLLVLAVVGNTSRTYEKVRASGVFAVTVLASDQVEIARWFAHPGRPSGALSFMDVAWRRGPHSGSPILTGGLSYFDCAVERADRAGDHTVLIGRVHAFDVLSDRAPLLFVRSHFADLPDRATIAAPWREAAAATRPD